MKCRKLATILTAILILSLLLPLSNVAAMGGFAASGAPGNALDSAGPNESPPLQSGDQSGDGTKLLQFTSEGHVLGFTGDGVIVASARHMLRIGFLDSRAIIPEADGDVSKEGNGGKARPLGSVTYRNIWDGVTVVYEASGESIVKSTYYVDAVKGGVQVDRIRLGYNRPVRIDEKGNLLVSYEDGIIVEGAPVAWQETEGGRKPVVAAYVLHGEREVGFSLDDYMPGIPVVIDPEMTWNTFLGGIGSDNSRAIAVDGSGNVYVGGTSNVTWGSPVRAYTFGDDAFAAKLDSSGSLIWNTFLGGSWNDSGYAIAVDGSGNVYVGGESSATWGSPVRAFTSGADAFAARLNSSGTLQWNTFLGGSGDDYGFAIAVDGSGNVYVGGFSDATWGSPVRAYTTPGADAFAAKLNSAGSRQWNTFLGGSGIDYGYAITVDGSGNVYVGGSSNVTWGTPVRAYTSGFDAFAAKLNSSGALQWHTFLGGSDYDYGRAIAVDGSGNVYVGGTSGATWGSPVRAYTGDDAFAAKLDSSNGDLQWNTFLGGSGFDQGYAIAVDGSGNVYIGGLSNVTWGLPVRAFTSDFDAFAARLNSSGTLQWNTFLGGSGDDYGFAIAVDGSGNVYIGGFSYGTWGSPVRAYTSSTDAFAVKLNFGADLAITKTDSPDPVLAGGMLTYTISVTNNGTSNATAVSVNDVIPAGTTYATSTATLGSYTAPVWTVGNMASGTWATLTLVVSVNPGTNFGLSNTATVTASTSDPNIVNNTATAQTNVLLLSLTKSVNPPTYSKVGDVLTYTLIATNNSSVTMTNVSINDPALGSLSCTPSQPATLAPGASLTCTGTHTIIQADLDSGSFKNIANASGSAGGGILLFATASVTAGISTTPQFLYKIPNQPAFSGPGRVAIAPDGSIWVADTGHNQLVKFDPNNPGLEIRIGSPGSGNGQFNSPYSLALDSSGNIYVADRGNHRIQKFSSTGTWLASWGSFGSDNGQFNYPTGLVLDGEGNIYVADTNNNRIQKLSSKGTWLASWGSTGSGRGQFDQPSGVALDSSGNIYVADRGNNRIQKLSSKGDWLASWGSYGNSSGQFDSPSDVALDSSGNIYVADTYNHRVQKLHSSGDWLASWGSPGSGKGQFSSPWAVALDRSGNIYVADSDNNRIQKLSFKGDWLDSWGTRGSGNGQFLYPSGVALDSSGNIYVADTQNNRIQKLDSTGAWLASWGSFGSGNGQFIYPWDVALDSSGNIYVADSNNHRIQKLSSTGAWLASWGSYGSGYVQFSYPTGVALDSSGNIYVADTYNNRIQKLNSSGDWLDSLGNLGANNGQFNSPFALALDSSGNIYVADSDNNRIQKLSSSGVWLASWGSSGSGNGQFIYPWDVALDSSGNIYVADSNNHRIQKLNSSGAWQFSLGTLGSGNGQFSYPRGVALDSSGNIYVADTNNNRIQVFGTIVMATRLEGDVNNDTRINSGDALLVAKHIVGTTNLTGDNFLAADVNDDTFINSADLLLIKKFIVGTLTQFPGGIYIP